jgi:lysophospholipase L1-like esterase
MIALSGANTTTIACGGSDVFNKAGGGTTLTLSLLNQGVLLQYKASSGIWYATADDLSLPQLDLRYIPQANGVTKLDNTTAIQLPKWLAACSRVADGTGDGKVVLIGDSTVLGFGSSPTTNQMRYSGPSKMIAGLLNQAGIVATNNGWAGDGGFRGAASESSQYDSRITVGAGWSTGGVKFLGGNSFTATSATSNLAYAPLENVDTFVVTYFKFSGGGSFSYNVDGGSNTTQSVNAANAIGTLTISVPSGLGLHTLNLNWVSGQVYILGIDAYDSSKNRISVINAGWGSSQTPDWTGVISVSGTSPYQLGQDLTIICLGINDCNVGTSVSVFQANLQQIITAAQAAGDVAIMTFTQSDPAYPGLAPAATQDAFNQAIRGLAVANDIPLVDVYARWQSFAVSNAVGLYYDHIHPNGQGYQNQWNAVYGVVGAQGLYKSPYGLMDLTIVSGNVTLSGRYGTVGVDTSAGNVTVTIPAAASSARRLFNVKKLSGANTLTIARTGSDAFYTSSPGNTSITMTADGQSYGLHADPANNRWLVI